jgi:hypothetical protein
LILASIWLIVISFLLLVSPFLSETAAERTPSGCLGALSPVFVGPATV